MAEPGVPPPRTEPNPPWITTPPESSSPLLRPPAPRQPTTQGAIRRTASANPDKLDDAAAAVAPDLRRLLASAAAPQGLAARIAEFNGAAQSPERSTVTAD